MNRGRVMNLNIIKNKWNFPSNNNGTITGIAESGIETFKGTPLKSLAREICQNSLDAKIENDKAVKVEFKSFSIKPENIPGSSEFNDVLKRCKDYWSIQTTNKATRFFENALAVMNQEEMQCLRISDFNTTGLLGARESRNSPWSNLTKSQGVSDKGSSSGGSFGIGKFAPFACSALRTIFYNTYDAQGIEACQGVSRLTSFEDKTGDTTQGVGFFGDENNMPILEQISLDQMYSRKLENKTGTDIFIMGFKAEKSWKEDIIAAIIDGFLYAIYSEKMIVEVDDVIIDHETLPHIIKQYKSNFDEYADEYYEAITSNSEHAKVYTTDILGMGNAKLNLIIHPGYHRRVAMIRKTGMKILNQSNISGIIQFSGVMYIEGEELNEYLRSLENPQHTKWEVDRADNKSQAKRVIKTLRDFIKESLNDLKVDDIEEEISPIVGGILTINNDSDAISEKEQITDKIKKITLFEKPITVNNTRTEPGTGTGKGNSTEPGTGKGTGTGTGKGNSTEPAEDKGTGEDNGTKSNGEVRGGRKKVIPLPIKTRVICRDKNKGEYTLVLTPEQNAKNATIKLSLGAESGQYVAQIKEILNSDYAHLEIKGDQITNFDFQKNQKINLNIKLEATEFVAVEVEANGYKL